MTKRTTKPERIQKLVQKVNELSYAMAQADAKAAEIRNELSDVRAELDRELGQ